VYLEERIEAMQAEIDELKGRLQEALDAADNSRAEWKTVKEAAEILHVSDQALYKRIREGEIYASTLTGCIRIPMRQFFEEGQRPITPVVKV